MATAAVSSRAEADTIKSAITSTSTCSSSTVEALQRLLSAEPRTLSQDGKESGKPKTKASSTTRTTQKTTATAKSKSKLKNSTAIAVHEDNEIPLSPREKFFLATDVVNGTLKSLSEALKPQPKLHRRISFQRPDTPKKASDSRGTSSPPDIRSLTRMPSYTQRPLLPRSVSQISNASTKPSLLRRSSSYSSIKQGPAAGLVATAECARLAFAYLRTSQAEKIAGKDLPALQLENGMLALVGKLMAHGLEGLAVKELRILKRRLVAFMGAEHKKAEEDGRSSTKATKVPVAQEKETLASLLRFESFDVDSPALPLVLSHQMSVLKIVAASHRPAIIEATLQHLQLSAPSSPANLMLALAKRPGSQDRAARQLEVFAQCLLSLCPSTSSSDDDIARNANTSIKPDIVFQLQMLAFRVRVHWWRIAGHKGDAERELMQPLAKCMSALSRRSTLPAEHTYEMAAKSYEELEKELDTVNLGTVSASSTTCSQSSRISIYNTLGSLAQNAALHEIARKWTETLLSLYTKTTASDARLATCSVRLATLALQTNLPKADEAVQLALDHLKGSLKGDSTDLDSLLAEVIGLRRAATKLILKSSTEAEPLHVLDQCTSVITASVHFLARYVGTSPSEGADPRAFIRHGERVAMASKVTKGFLDSVALCVKHALDRAALTWGALDSVLQDCCRVIIELQGGPDADEHQSMQTHTDLQYPFVKTSNLYWMYYLHHKKAADSSDDTVLRALRRSADMLKSRSTAEKTAGFLAIKLEKVAAVYESSRRFGESYKFLKEAVEVQIGTGALRVAAEMAATTPLRTLFEAEGSTALLARTLKSLVRATRKQGLREGPEMIMDDTTLQPAERGLLLELQLADLMECISKERAVDSVISRLITSLLTQLLDVYAAAEFPLRRQRVCMAVLRIAADQPDIVLNDLITAAVECANTSHKLFGSDSGLQCYQKHFSAALDVQIAFRSTPPVMEKLKASILTWQSIVDATDSCASLSAQIDDIDAWLSQLTSISDYLDVQGFGTLRVPTLTLITRVIEFREQSDATSLVNQYCQLGLQYLRMGYSGKAGMTLAKAQSLLDASAVSTEARLQYHLAYAEYLLAIGNLTSCEESLAATEAIAKNDSEFLELTKPSTTFSGRIRYSRILADASYVNSLLRLENGSADQALAHARRCVKLNERVWASLENRCGHRKASSEADASDADMESLAASMASLAPPSRSGPVIRSMTHDALNGAQFWSLVPSLFRGLQHLARVFAHQGVFQESVYFAERASKIANAVHADTLIVESHSVIAKWWAQGAKVDKGLDFVTTAKEHAHRAEAGRAMITYKCSVAQVRHAQNDIAGEMEALEEATNILDQRTSTQYIHGLDRLVSSDDSLSDQLAQMKLGTSDICHTATRAKPTRTRKPAVKTTAKSTRTVSKHGAGPVSSSAMDGCRPLLGLRGDILRQKAAALLLQDKLTTAAALLAQAASIRSGHEDLVQQSTIDFRRLVLQATKEMAADFTFNVLPESTISFPALARPERKMSEPAASRAAFLSPLQKPMVSSPSPRKGGRAKRVVKEDFTATLRNARDCVAEVQALALQTCSVSVVHQICTVFSHITVLLSAVNHGVPKGSLHPLSAALSMDLPKIHALQREMSMIECEKRPLGRDDLLKWWPSALTDTERPAQLTASQFQKDYIDIIPETWTAVSLSLNENRDELYITRYRAGQSPFIVRLPMARHRSDDVDEDDVFGFDAGKKELLEIIELSNYSAHDTPDLSVKGAKSEWWAGREALDARLRDLLVNIENIWLGGFRSILSQHIRQPNLLARFQSSFQNILNRHLPSRRGRAQSKKLQLDPRILELFVGLGDATDEELDLDEPLLDLLYFVVDILQFNGERNAYDEIDFDSIAIETLDALRAYHSSSSSSSPPQHTILILDKPLHAFPWESLPCMRTLSVSRLPSLESLRTRILAAHASHRRNTTTPPAPGQEGHYIPLTSGTAILNPAGDLAHTQATLSPYLATLPAGWTQHVGRAPTESDFTTALGETQLLLYFGHGSGAQYIRSRSVKRLAAPCATAWLMGCSSGAVAEHGVFEPSGMVLSYLVAGAPAVVGTLWDVTDRDCDRFAVRCGDVWGLWKEREEKGGSKGKGRGKGADVERARGARVVGRRERDGGERGGTEDGAMGGEGHGVGEDGRKVGLVEAVARSRDACYLKYLNGAALVVYGIPVFLS